MKSATLLTTVLAVQLILLTMAVSAVSYESDFQKNNNEVDIGTLEHYETDQVTKSKIIKSKIIDRRIEKGMNYLYENQLPSGEFSTYISYSPNMSGAKNFSVVFDTTFILHTLNLADNKKTEEIVNEMITRAVVFLLDNREPPGVWRHEGKYLAELGPPDTDDTSMAFAALVESGVNISDESLNYMLNYRTPDGIFYTWINSDEWLDPSNPYYEYYKMNDIDANVNADVIYAYSLRNITHDEVVRYLNGISENKSFLNGTIYYPSPYVYAYLVTKAYSDGDIKELKPSLNNIKDYLLSTQNKDGGWGNDLYTALASVSLINMNYKGEALEKAVEHIMDNQRKNGSWGTYSFYIAPSSPTIYYGSRELTTSFSLEALIKYKMR
ncbi:hypothetical protein ig2599ANME_1577 [groundwater metagenome]